MHTDVIELLSTGPGARHHLQVLHFGPPDARPVVTIQAALHADEVPAMLVAQVLRHRFEALEAQGQLLGHVRLLPWANPLGLGQQLLGQHQGRFDLRDGINFNRQHADLTGVAAQAVEGRLGDDAARNTRLIRDALVAAAAALPAPTPAQDLKRRLLQQAVDSDVVIDLHCDSRALMHLYALTPQADLAAELGALLGAHAVLLSTDSGDSPFDEACSRPWLNLQALHPGCPVPLACFSTTVELRGEGDTQHALAQQDADAIVEFLRRRGVVRGPLQPLPPARSAPTMLAASEPIVAPRAGIVVFHQEPGAHVEAGDLIADLVDPATGEVHGLRCSAAGLLYARSATHWATPGKRLAKIAGTSLARIGPLLSP